MSQATDRLRRRSLGTPLVALFALAAVATVAAAAAEPRVVIALDSSRSLTAEQSHAASALARDIYVRLSAATQPSLLTFDDSVHWLVRQGSGGAGASDAALDALRPTGRFTVLHDGLVEGIRSLADGGVVVVITDGKDENSATTLEDVARLASERGVRVVTLGAGRVDERTMRRLALLTGGVFADVTAGADPDALAAEVESLRRQVAAEKPAPPAAAAPAAPTAPVAAPVAAAAPPPQPVARPSGDGSRLLLLGALVAVVGVVLGLLLARRRAPVRAAQPPEVDIDTRPGVEMPPPAPSRAASPAPEPVDEIQLARLRARPAVPPAGLPEISLDDTATFQSLPFSETIERTLVLTEEVVLTVREPGQERRSYGIPAGRAIDVGRDAKHNSLAFQDPTMSMRHFRLALDEGEIFLVDLGSTNGVLFKERVVDSAQLWPGDRFRAGMIEFEIGLHRASVS